MTVKEVRALLAPLPDDAEVMIEAEELYNDGDDHWDPMRTEVPVTSIRLNGKIVLFSNDT